MNDHDLDSLVARAAPMTDAEIAEWTLNAPYGELCESIIGDSAGVDADALAIVPAASAGRLRRSIWHRPTLVRAAVIVALTVFAVSIGVTGDSNAPDNRAWAAPLVEFAQRSPLLLIDDPAWQVARADEYGNQGEMTFTDGDETAELYWRNEGIDALIDDLLRDGGIDRGHVPTASGSAVVVEQPNTASNPDSDVVPVVTAESTAQTASGIPTAVTTTAASGTGGSRFDPQFHALFESGGHVVQFVGSFGTLNEFTAMVAKLTSVDVDTWLEAMPASVIQAADYTGLVTDLLSDVPLPPGFDPAMVNVDADVKDRYQFIANLTSAVTCAWLDQWFSGGENGDDTRQDAAAAALATARQWTMLLEIESLGAFAQAVWEWADAINGGPGIVGGRGPAAPTRELAEAGLNCQFK